LFLIAGSVSLGLIGLSYAQADLYQGALKSELERGSRPSGQFEFFRQTANRLLPQTHKFASETRPVEIANHLIFRSVQLTTPHHMGSSIKSIEIARIGLEAMVLEGDDQETLRLAVGHIPGTAVPSLSGNVGLAGHRDTFFRPLERIRVGDVIRVSTDDGQFEYRVASTLVVLPLNVEVLDDTPRPTLTLVTCYPFHYVGAAPKRFIVRAEMTSAHTAK
jgi:sortase A